MKKILNLLLISLALLTISCSSSPDVMDTAIAKQKQLDKAYEEAVTKSQTDTPSKAKSTEPSKPKSDDTAKAKSTEPDPKAKTDPAPKAKTDPAPKAKIDPAPKAKIDPAPKAKITILNVKEMEDLGLMNEISLKIKQAALEGTLSELDPGKLCSSISKIKQFSCVQKVKIDIQNLLKNSKSDQHQPIDPNAKDPCASVPNVAKAECEKGIADMRKRNEASKAKEAAEAKEEADKYVQSFDPNNIPKIAKFNFTDLDKFSRMSKIRSAVGHNYSYKTDEDDPTRQNCKSMKHYLIPIGAAKTHGAYSTTPHTFKWMTIKFYSPVNGVINHIEYTENQFGTEANFGIQATDKPAKGYYFDYYHIALDPNLKVGSTIKAGQQVGTLGAENAYSEIAVSAHISKTKIHLISFLEVASDEIFNLYKNRGVNSPSDVIITRQERDANPLPCDNSEAGWFIGSSRSNKPDINFQKWVFESEENWFFFK